MTVFLTYTAERELSQIWLYNAQNRSVWEADAYDVFLRDRIRSLARGHTAGTRITYEPEWQFVTARKKPKSDGHVIVYHARPETQVVWVLHVFHTKQDWQGKIKRGEA